ncbi:uncharacterized protein LOC134467158 [Engraulis encrasicolus]|uniref:uncharacterized protein LOC134467158 n=1 Tax=Engraulis encrasicolus TaxID=184585 RepID=UPI002FD76E01
MEGEGGREEEDGPKPRKRDGKGPVWRVYFMACLLCCARKPEVDEEGQGEGKPAATKGFKRWTNKTSDKDSGIKTKNSQHNGQKTEKQKKKTRALVRWINRRFKAQPDMDSKLGVHMSTEERAICREEAQRRERACLEAYRCQQAKEEARQETIRNIQRSRKAKEAALQIFSSLPPSQEEHTRPLTSKEVISGDSWTRRNRERNRKKWHNLLFGMMKAQIRKDLEEVKQREMAVRRREMPRQMENDIEEAKRRAWARVARQRGHEKDQLIDLKGCRNELIHLILAVAFFALPIIWLFGD